MLRALPCHLLYQESLLLNLTLFFLTDRERVVELDKSISKLYLLNLDKLPPIIKPLYLNTGRSAKNQQGIIRSLVLMLDQGFHDLRVWASMAAVNVHLDAWIKHQQFSMIALLDNSSAA